MKYYKLILLIVAVGFISCENRKDDKPLFIASSFPVYSILTEITKDVATVRFLVPTGASPHTYAPKPSDIKNSSQALAFFSVAENLDGWISQFPSDRKIKLIDMVPVDKLIYFSCGHDHSDTEITNSDHNHEIDPHFWLDPLTVKDILKELTDSLVQIYPKGKLQFLQNSNRFSNLLDSIHNEAEDILKPVMGGIVFLHHPSFNYMLHRYSIYYGGSIEESPGKEPSPKFISDLIKLIKESGAKAIFSEPQLSTKTAEMIAKESGVKLLELNPEGMKNSKGTYKDIIINNSIIIKSGLE